MENFDVRRNILYHLPIKSVNNLCLTDKLSLNIYSDKYFWINKFKNEDLILLNPDNLTINNWIKEYNKMLKIKKDINRIFIISAIDNTYGFKQINFGQINISVSGSNKVNETIKVLNGLKEFSYLDFKHIVDTFVENHDTKNLDIRIKISKCQNYSVECYVYGDSYTQTIYNTDQDFNILLSEDYNIKQITNILTKALYYKLWVHDNKLGYIIEKGHRVNRGAIMRETLNYLDHSSYDHLEKNEGKTIMLILNIERYINEILIKKTINPIIARINTGENPDDLIPIEYLSNIRDFCHSNDHKGIEIVIFKIDETYSVAYKLGFGKNHLYNVMMNERVETDAVIQNLLTKTINGGYEIYDSASIKIAIDGYHHSGYNKDYAKRVVIYEVLRYLNY